MYKLISVLSLLIRQFCFPNPFECFGDSAILINWIVGIVMAPITYLIVGLVYDKGSEPAVGSLLYLLTYTLLTGVLYVMSIFSFAWWSVLGVLIAFVGVMYGLVRLNEHIADREDWRDY